jgi:alpha-ribazole phosphatase
MDLYILRHSPVDNPEGLCYGQSEMPIKKDFSHGLEILKDYFSRIQNLSVYHSGSLRTQFLGDALGFKHAIPDARLHELNFGNWEGKPWKDIPEKEIQHWMYRYYFSKVTGGESFEEMNQRIRDFIKSILVPRIQSPSPLLVITHAGPIRCFLLYFLKINPYNLFHWKIPEGEFWKVSLENNQSPIVYPPRKNLLLTNPH